jgi:DNA topoisomerase-1
MSSDDSDDEDFALSSLKKKDKKVSAKKKKAVTAPKKTPPTKKTSAPVKKPKVVVNVKPDPAPSSSAPKKRKNGESTHGGTPTKKVKTEGPPKKELKRLEKAERLQYAMQAFLWWNAEELPEGYQWRTMEHAGVSFPDPYVPHKIKMKYDGKDVELTPAQEEA